MIRVFRLTEGLPSTGPYLGLNLDSRSATRPQCTNLNTEIVTVMIANECRMTPYKQGATSAGCVVNRMALARPSGVNSRSPPGLVVLKS